jgi:chromate transport protein ChrA
MPGVESTSIAREVGWPVERPRGAGVVAGAATTFAGAFADLLGTTIEGELPAVVAG